MLRINPQHRLEGDGVVQRPTPNVGGRLKPRFIVMHYTAGGSAQGAVAWLCNPAAKASAHLVLARDGTIFQLAPFDVVTWHAGVSHWGELTGLNAHAIGIEMDNAGRLRRVGSEYQSSFGKRYPAGEVMLATHKHESVEQAWHAYSEPQIERAFELAELLGAQYGITELLGHEDIAEGRKSDPGPAFPLAALAARVAGRTDDDFPRRIVSASQLNIRSGPGAQFAAVAAPLKSGTELALLAPGERWSRVAVLGSDVEGWVATAFLSLPPKQAAQPAPQGAAGRGAKATAKSAAKSTTKGGTKSTGKRASQRAA